METIVYLLILVIQSFHRVLYYDFDQASLGERYLINQASLSF